MSYQKQQVIYKARGGRRTITVWERVLSGRVERAYAVTGAGWNVGSLFSNSWTRAECITRAIEAWREGRPKARLVVLVEC